MPDSVLHLSCVSLCLFFMTLLPSRAVPQGGAGQNWGQELQLVHPTNLPLPWLTVICAHSPHPTPVIRRAWNVPSTRLLSPLTTVAPWNACTMGSSQVCLA